MQQHGIESVVYTYCGRGDSGQEEEIDAVNSKDSNVSVNDLAQIHVDAMPICHLSENGQSLKRFLQGMLEKILNRNHGGYENNEGGSGVITYHSDGTYSHEMFTNMLDEEITNHSGTYATKDEKIKTQLEEFNSALKMLNVKAITMSYAGRGDSGQESDIEEVHFEKESNLSTKAALATKLDGKIKNVFDFAIAISDDLQGQNHSGYENNDGGSGTITYNAIGTYTHETVDCFMEEEISYAKGHVFETVREPKSPSP
jgi:hypothetical protein